MIVRQFLHWVRQASAAERADATAALARAYLHSDLSSDDRAAAEGAMLMLLDDPSPLVRRALSQAIASSPEAPPAVVRSLAADQPDVALPILTRSPLLEADDLVDLMAGAAAEIQAAIAGRPDLPRPLAAAIAEVGCSAACLALLDNPDASIPPFSVRRLVERFGHMADVRERLLAHEDLSMSMRQALLTKLSESLAGFVSARHWLGPEHAENAAREACEKATVALAAETPYDEVSALVQHLRDTKQLTAGMLLRALLSGNVVLVEEALAELSGLPIDRVIGYIHDKTISAFHALYSKADLPQVAYPAFREAIQAMREGALVGEHGGVSRLKRLMVERVLKACTEQHGGDRSGEIAALLALLRRFAVEAAREEARVLCEDLMADRPVAPAPIVQDDALLDELSSLDDALLECVPAPGADNAAVAVESGGAAPEAQPEPQSEPQPEPQLEAEPELIATRNHVEIDAVRIPDERKATVPDVLPSPAKAKPPSAVGQRESPPADIGDIEGIRRDLQAVLEGARRDLEAVLQDAQVSIVLSLDDAQSGARPAADAAVETPASADNDSGNASRVRNGAEERLVA